MLYMVEMDLPDRSQVEQWHEWYAAHIRKLLTVDGYYASQRFEALSYRTAPFLAIHDVNGPDMFEGTSYRTVGGPSGTGEWRDQMTNWSRNLFEGCDALPEIASDEKLAIIEEAETVPDIYAQRVTWLKCVGLDRTIPKRGFAVLTADEDTRSLQDVGIDLFKPITEKMF